MVKESYGVCLESQFTNKPDEYLEDVKFTRVPIIGQKISLSGHMDYYRVEDVKHSAHKSVKKNFIRNIMHFILPNMRAKCFSKGKHLETVASIEVIVRKEELGRKITELQ